MTDADDTAATRAFEEHLAGMNQTGLRLGYLLVSVLMPAGLTLDYVTHPEHLQSFFWIRAITTALALALLAVSYVPTLPRAVQNALGSFLLILPAAGIEAMILRLDGVHSAYYAGLNLVILAMALLFTWKWWRALSIGGVIVAMWLVPAFPAVTAGQVQWSTFFNNAYFLVLTVVIATSSMGIRYGAALREFEARREVARTSTELAGTLEKLREADRLKTEFFANITHELKTPLAMMLAPLELLVDGQLGTITDAQRSTLRTVQKNGVKLLRLIGDLLDLSKLEESRLRLRIDEQDLVSYLNGLVGQIDSLAQRKALTVRFDSNVPRSLMWCDLERIERVFVNLLSNATKFTPAGGTISVALEDDGSTVTVHVADTGIGFPQEMGERIFERFFQVDGADTRRFGGTGIGLALSKELVELHGGTIAADSTPGEGATFHVAFRKGRSHFPADVLDRRSPTADRTGARRTGDRGLAEWQLSEADDFRLLDIDQATDQRIVERDVDEERRPFSVLVVEDTPDVIRVIRLALHHEFRVLAAPDGRKGIELARKHHPTIVITDLMMPEIDGLELTRRLRADPSTKHIPIIMLTARGDVEDRVAGLETGVNAYLAKPFSTKELVTTVRSQLEKQQTTADVLLTQRLDSLETMAGGLAHQIRNPLNYVKNALNAVERDIDALVASARGTKEPLEDGVIETIVARSQRMFDTAEKGVQRIGAAVDLMIRYSREGYTRTAQPYDLHAAIQDVLDLVVPAAGYSLRVSTSLRGAGTIECVPEELNQVLTNLIENAIQAVPSDGTGTISVRTWNDGSFLVLSIRDNGVGIAPEDQAKIFTAFYTTKDSSRGMGLGLTIVTRVVAALGGTIRVASEVGLGTELVVRLPQGARRDLGATTLDETVPEITS